MEKYKYYTFQWHITDRCDQRCKHCYIYAENNNKYIDEISLDEATGVVNNCIRFCQKIDRKPHFVVIGGDPILHPNFWDILEILKNHNIRFTMAGNPFHITDEIMLQIKEYGCDCYQMSIDGVKDTNDWFRKQGSFEETIQKIQCINNANIMSAIMTTVSSKNIKEIPELMEIVAKSKVGVFAFSRYCQTSEDKDIGISPLEYRELLRLCDEKKQELIRAGYKTRFVNKDHLWALYEYEKNQYNKDSILNYHQCSCISNNLTILPTADIHICRRAQNGKLGNIFDDDLYDLWQLAMKKYKNTNNYEKCKYCEIADKCLGCPAVADSSTGDFFAPDPQCWKYISK